MSFKINNSEIIYRGPIFNLRQDIVTLPNGRSTQFDIIDHRDAVTMIPIDQNGNIWFIRQYRHPTRKELLELPAGVMEPNETPKFSAQREIREEIGMRANRLEKIGGFFLAPGYSTEYMHIFLARDLVPDALPGDDNEFLSIQKIQSEHAFRMAEKGQIQDAKTIISLIWVSLFLRNFALCQG